MSKYIGLPDTDSNNHVEIALVNHTLLSRSGIWIDGLGSGDKVYAGKERGAKNNINIENLNYIDVYKDGGRITGIEFVFNDEATKLIGRKKTYLGTYLVPEGKTVFKVIAYSSNDKPVYTADNDFYAPGGVIGGLTFLSK